MNKGRRTYLVTGGAGFIGTNFIKHLLSTYSRDEIGIVVVDNLTYAGNLSNLAEEIDRGEVVFEKGNIADSVFIEKIFTEYTPDYVVNFAAETHVDRSIDDSRIFIETNVLGTQTLLEVARRCWLNGNADGKRFLQVSTDEVYGSLTRDFQQPERMEQENLPEGITTSRSVLTYGKELFTERTPLSPRSPYSASKAAADMLVMAYGKTYGLPVLITRCSNNYGPYQFPEKLIPLIINNLLQGKELPVYGLGLNVRDWLYVDDHVRAIDMVLRNGDVGHIYNVGGLNEMENIAIVRTIIEIFARLTATEPRYDLIKFVKDRPGHDMRYAIDPSKMASNIGWQPETAFADGIEKTVKWYLDNREWMDKVVSGEYLSYYSKMYDNR